MKDKDIKHLEWVYERMKCVHNEDERYSYMIRFREINEALRKDHTAKQIPCNRCQFKEKYNTGIQNAFKTVEHCSKGYWYAGDTPSIDNKHKWYNCVDFLPKP
jgi:hypothetical protein